MKEPTCPHCINKGLSHTLKQVDEPNGGGYICNRCNTFIRYDGFWVTPDEVISKAERKGELK